MGQMGRGQQRQAHKDAAAGASAGQAAAHEADASVGAGAQQQAQPKEGMSFEGGISQFSPRSESTGPLNGPSNGMSSGGPVQAKATDRGNLSRGLKGGTGGGKPLPPGTRSKMEQSFGADFSDVRVGTSAETGKAGAQAAAQGSKLSFAPGKYAPGTAAGDRLIGHELAHVVQQRAGKVSTPQGKGGGVSNDPVLEAEADRMGDRAAVGQPAVVSGGSAGLAAKTVTSGSVTQHKKKKVTNQEVIDEMLKSIDARAGDVASALRDQSSLKSFFSKAADPAPKRSPKLFFRQLVPNLGRMSGQEDAYRDAVAAITDNAVKDARIADDIEQAYGSKQLEMSYLLDVLWHGQPSKWALIANAAGHIAGGKFSGRRLQELAPTLSTSEWKTPPAPWDKHVTVLKSSVRTAFQDRGVGKADLSSFMDFMDVDDQGGQGILADERAAVERQKVGKYLGDLVYKHCTGKLYYTFNQISYLKEVLPICSRFSEDDRKSFEAPIRAGFDRATKLKIRPAKVSATVEAVLHARPATDDGSAVTALDGEGAESSATEGRTNPVLDPGEYTAFEMLKAELSRSEKKNRKTTDRQETAAGRMVRLLRGQPDKVRAAFINYFLKANGIDGPAVEVNAKGQIQGSITDQMNGMVACLKNDSKYLFDHDHGVLDIDTAERIGAAARHGGGSSPAFDGLINLATGSLKRKFHTEAKKLALALSAEEVTKIRSDDRILKSLWTRSTPAKAAKPAGIGHLLRFHVSPENGDVVRSAPSPAMADRKWALQARQAFQEDAQGPSTGPSAGGDPAAEVQVPVEQLADYWASRLMRVKKGGSHFYQALELGQLATNAAKKREALASDDPVSVALNARDAEHGYASFTTVERFIWDVVCASGLVNSLRDSQRKAESNAGSKGQKLLRKSTATAAELRAFGRGMPLDWIRYQTVLAFRNPLTARWSTMRVIHARHGHGNRRKDEGARAWQQASDDELLRDWSNESEYKAIVDRATNAAAPEEERVAARSELRSFVVRIPSDQEELVASLVAEQDAFTALQEIQDRVSEALQSKYQTRMTADDRLAMSYEIQTERMKSLYTGRDAMQLEANGQGVGTSGANQRRQEAHALHMGSHHHTTDLQEEAKDDSGKATAGLAEDSDLNAALDEVRENRKQSMERNAEFRELRARYRKYFMLAVKGLLTGIAIAVLAAVSAGTATPGLLIAIAVAVKAAEKSLGVGIDWATFGESRDANLKRLLFSAFIGALSAPLSVLAVDAGVAIDAAQGVKETTDFGVHLGAAAAKAAAGWAIRDAPLKVVSYFYENEHPFRRLTEQMTPQDILAALGAELGSIGLTTLMESIGTFMEANADAEQASAQQDAAGGGDGTTPDSSGSADGAVASDSESGVGASSATGGTSEQGASGAVAQSSAGDSSTTQAASSGADTSDPVQLSEQGILFGDRSRGVHRAEDRSFLQATKSGQAISGVDDDLTDSLKDVGAELFLGKSSSGSAGGSQGRSAEDARVWADRQVQSVGAERNKAIESLDRAANSGGTLSAMCSNASAAFRQEKSIRTRGQRVRHTVSHRGAAAQPSLALLNAGDRELTEKVVALVGALEAKLSEVSGSVETEFSGDAAKVGVSSLSAVGGAGVCQSLQRLSASVAELRSAKDPAAVVGQVLASQRGSDFGQLVATKCAVATEREKQAYARLQAELVGVTSQLSAARSLVARFGNWAGTQEGDYDINSDATVTSFEQGVQDGSVACNRFVQLKAAIPQGDAAAAKGCKKQVAKATSAMKRLQSTLEAVKLVSVRAGEDAAVAFSLYQAAGSDKTADVVAGCSNIERMG